MWNIKIKNLNFKKGFTLIEIIVVLIIVGVLAALSLTSLFQWIDRSRVAEAVLTLKNTVDRADQCVLSNDAACINQIVSSASSPYFIYGEASSSSGNYVFTAYWNEGLYPRSVVPVTFPSCAPGIVAGANHYGWVVVCLDPVTHVRTLGSGGVFQGMY